MLAEECRYRWLGIVENEGCIIDDISCIIIDFEKNLLNLKDEARNRYVKAFKSLTIPFSGQSYNRLSIRYEEEIDEKELFLTNSNQI